MAHLEDYFVTGNNSELLTLFNQARTSAHDYLVDAIADVDERFPAIDGPERFQMIAAYMQAAANIFSAAVIAERSRRAVPPQIRQPSGGGRLRET